MLFSQRVLAIISKQGKNKKPLTPKECELNNLRFLSGYFALIFHFIPLKISTFMQEVNPKLSTKPLAQKPQLI
ncbi:MAG: hypothetical protein ACJAT4_003025 [Granulosicoccus sp.]